MSGALRPGDLGVAQQRQGREIELQEGIACSGQRLEGQRLRAAAVDAQSLGREPGIQIDLAVGVVGIALHSCDLQVSDRHSTDRLADKQAQPADGAGGQRHDMKRSVSGSRANRCRHETIIETNSRLKRALRLSGKLEAQHVGVMRPAQADDAVKHERKAGDRPGDSQARRSATLSCGPRRAHIRPGLAAVNE